MTDIRVGVVCEGPSDFAIIEWSLKQALGRQGHTSEFHPIHPIRDKTSGVFDDGGWHQVYRWCVRNDRTARQRFFGQGLFDDDDAIAVDVLLVHIDGDVHVILASGDLWKKVTSVDPAGYENSPSGTLQFGHDLIVDWLFGGDANRDVALPTPTVLESEAWLLAGLRWHNNAETVDEPKAEFARQWLTKAGKPIQPGIRKLSNHLDVVRYAASIEAADVDNIRSTCTAFNSIVERLLVLYPRT